MSRPVRFECPYLHFPEPLAAELRLAAERLLSDQRIWSDAARVNLVINQVRQLHHVDVADGNLLLEWFAADAVKQNCLAASRQSGIVEQFLDLRFAYAVKHRRREWNPVHQGASMVNEICIAHFTKALLQLRSRKHFLVNLPQLLGASVIGKQIGNLLRNRLRG